MAFQGDSIYWVEVEKVVPNPFQPRREFDEQKLKELADSVRMYGILQPLTVTRNEIQREDGTFYTEYELIAGERRLRASKLAGLSQVPVIIREGEDSEQEKLELAIIENLQREDLNSVDRALAFRQLADVFGLSHTQVAKKVGRSREYVSNSIRLLGLPDYMLNSLRLAEMTEGHARTLLMLNDRPEEQDVVFREILLKKLSVREVERIVRKIATDKVRKRHAGDFDTELIEMEKQFMETLGTRVQIQKTTYGGQLTIDYFSVEDLEAMLLRMKVEGPIGAVSNNEQADKLTQNTPLAFAAPVVAAVVTEVVEEKEKTQEELEAAERGSGSTEMTEEESAPYVEEGRFDALMNATDESLISPETTEEVPSLNQSGPVNDNVPVSPEMDEKVSGHNEVAVEVLDQVAGEDSNENVSETVEEVKEEQTPPPAVVEVKKDDDDSDLYSIRHFGV